MCLGNICRITFLKYTKHPIKQSLKISTCSFKNMKTCNLFMAYQKNGFQDPERTQDAGLYEDPRPYKNQGLYEDPGLNEDQRP